MDPIFILAIEANRNLIQFGKERQSLHPKMISTTLSKKKKDFQLGMGLCPPQSDSEVPETR